MDGGARQGEGWDQRHIPRDCDSARLPAQFAGHWGKGGEIVYGEEKLFCTGLTRAAKGEQKSLVPARQAKCDQPRKDPFIFTL
jgi:hypothetical protein